MTFPKIAQLIPHAEPMVLLDEMIAWEKGSATCRFVVREHAPFVDDGVLAVPTTIEHMAQAVAACLGYEAFLGGEGVRVGMIIACRKLTVHAPRLMLDDVVTIHVARARGSETLSHFDCRVVLGEMPVATATLTLFHGEPPGAKP